MIAVGALSEFIFDEDTPRTSTERYRQRAVRLYELADALTIRAQEAMLHDPGDVTRTVNLYDAAAKILIDANKEYFQYLTVRDCAGEA